MVLTLVVGLAAAGLIALLVNVFQRQQEARNPFYRVVELSDDIDDPQIWGREFSSAVRRLPPDGGSGAHALWRK